MLRELLRNTLSLNKTQRLEATSYTRMNFEYRKVSTVASFAVNFPSKSEDEMKTFLLGRKEQAA
jgi:hypothetical protein